MPTLREYMVCAEQLQTLANPIRLEIIKHLTTRNSRVTEICNATSYGMCTVSQHLQILKAAGLVRAKRDGRYLIYCLDPGICKRSDAVGVTIDFGYCSVVMPCTV